MVKLMHSCEQASALSSRALEEPLRPVERFQLGFHLMMCRHCSRFARQIDFLRRASRKVPEILEKDPG
jgi:hypothetical protein